MKRAFSLIELIVVIGIIAVLSAVIMGTFSGGTESARAARCMSNLRNLAAACQSYAMVNEHYPLAGSVERCKMSGNKRKRNVKVEYEELHGWISWNSAGKYSKNPGSPIGSMGMLSSTYCQNEEERLYCLTNGALWKYISASHEVFLCPSHVKAQKKLNPNWSYVMNAYFGCSVAPGSETYDSGWFGVGYGGLDRADRTLLFAEMPFAGIGVTAKTTTSSGFDCDCTLQYRNLKGCSANETIGFNHRSGKLTCGNVVFADGHVEKLIYPKEGLSANELQDLTTWLCYPYEQNDKSKGFDVFFDGRKYQKKSL